MEKFFILCCLKYDRAVSDLLFKIAKISVSCFLNLWNFSFFILQILGILNFLSLICETFQFLPFESALLEALFFWNFKFLLFKLCGVFNFLLLKYLEFPSFRSLNLCNFQFAINLCRIVNLLSSKTKKCFISWKFKSIFKTNFLILFLRILKLKHQKDNFKSIPRNVYFPRYIKISKLWIFMHTLYRKTSPKVSEYNCERD